METIVSAVTSGLIGLLNGLFETLGKGLGLAILVAVFSWFGVEHMTPSNASRRTNTIMALLFGVVLTILVHYGVSPYANVGAAAVYGLLGGLGALPFHSLIAKRYFPEKWLAVKE